MPRKTASGGEFKTANLLRIQSSGGPLHFEIHERGLPMRRGLLGFLAALALGSVSPAAFAADMAPAPEPVAVGSWTGFYLGAGGGVGWADIDINHRRCLLDWDGNCDPDNDFHHDFNEN